MPVVFGSHGGFGDCAQDLWELLKARAKHLSKRSWKHSWTATTYAQLWVQKISVALVTKIAESIQERLQLATRARALGLGVESARGAEGGDYVDARESGVWGSGI